MVTIEPITRQNALIFRELRLRALQDDPMAFGSTYSKECELTEADWIARALRWDGERGVGFLAMDGIAPCGLAGSFLDQQESTRAHLLSMWTAPTHRRRGIGRQLVSAVVDWAKLRGARVLRLMVTSNNKAAFSFYQHLGFTPSGCTEPYPNDPRLVEYEMLRPPT